MGYQKEFALGEELQCGISKLKVVKSVKSGECTGCFFKHICEELEANVLELDIIKGACCSFDRSDGEDVIFAELK